MNTLRSREKKIANFFLFRDLNTVCPIYCRSIKINAAKYCFNAITASFSSTVSELKIRIRNSGIRERTQAIVVGIERDGEKILSPKANTIFAEGDIIWIVGEKSKIKILKNN